MDLLVIFLHYCCAAGLHAKRLEKEEQRAWCKWHESKLKEAKERVTWPLGT